MQLERERNDALRDAGRERKKRVYWQVRYAKARHNAAKVRALRAEVRVLNQKVKGAEAKT